MTSRVRGPGRSVSRERQGAAAIERFAAGLIGGRFLESSARREESASRGERGLRQDSWMEDVQYGDGFLSPDDLEEYESRRFGGQGFGSSSKDDFRDTMPMGAPSERRASNIGGSSSSSSIGREGASYTSSPRVESEGPKVAPTPIVNAASANENRTAPMPATQGSPGASASTSSSSVPSSTDSSRNGNAGRV